MWYYPINSVSCFSACLLLRWSPAAAAVADLEGKSTCSQLSLLERACSWATRRERNLGKWSPFQSDQPSKVITLPKWSTFQSDQPSRKLVEVSSKLHHIICTRSVGIWQFGIRDLVKCTSGIVAPLWDFGQQPWIWQFGIWEVFIRRSCCIIPGLFWCYCYGHWHGLAFGECNRNPQPFSESAYLQTFATKKSFFTTGWFLAEIVLVML